MRYIAVITAALLICGFSIAGAQETYFGKNKVQYRNFDWNYIQTDHFDIYFYDGEYDLAKFAAEELEKSYGIITEQLKYFVARRIPVFIYSSHNDFQQTNIIGEDISEGLQGFTEVFKNRMVVHFMGSYAEFRHLLHHELSHAVAYDLVYGQFFKSLISSSRLFVIPLWLAEGYAEYTSNGGWTAEADMIVRDATVHGYLRPPGYMGGLAYTEGFAFVKYIVDTYGIEKTGEIFKKGKALISIDKALKSSLGLDSKELFEKFNKEMKKRYWPDIAAREEPIDFAKQLTHQGEDGSFYNEKPVFSPDGRLLAIFTNRNGYSEIYLISPIDGKEISRLVKGERNSALESLRWYTSGMSFSPNSENLVFVAKSKGEDALNFLKIRGKDIFLSKKFGLKSIISPAWSPDGKMVAFTALDKASRNIYLYHLEQDRLLQLTNELYDDIDVAWYPDSKRIIFSSDRPHPENGLDITEDEMVYGYYNLHSFNLDNGSITAINVGPGNNREPVISPDGKKIAFVSGRNGIENLYIYYVDSARTQAVTDAITEISSPTWNDKGDKLAFSTFYKGGFDVYVMSRIEPKGENGVLTLTDFANGKFDNPIEWARKKPENEHVELNHIGLAVTDNSPIDPDYPIKPAGEPSEFAQVIQDDGNKSKIGGIDDENPNNAEEVTDSTQTMTPPEEESSTDSTYVRDKTEETGEEDIYVFHAPPSEESVFSPSGKIMTEDGQELFDEEPVDSLLEVELNNRLKDGEYKIRPYKTKFTPDIISGGLQYDTFFGFRGQTVFLFSDYLGDHEIIIATDLVNTIDQSNIQAFYNYKRHRINIGGGLFHTKNFYINGRNELFSDRFYGFLGIISWPQSRYTRIDMNLATFFIDRRNYDNPLDEKRNVRLSTATLSWTQDNVLWGITGPVKGRRFKLGVEGATPVFGAESLEYYSGEIDYRQYFPLSRSFTFAFRYSGGLSNGAFPKNYYLGGNVNNIGSISVDNSVYDVENLYFSSLITPLRGYDYYDLVGDRYSVVNMELRFPFIDYFVMRYPLSLGIARIQGALFLDIGAAWNKGDDTFKAANGTMLIGIKSGFGFGARANLGFILLRYDLAWRTDFDSVEPHTKHYFSLGADF
ncbi:MAG: hypothetical protein ABIE07_00235 [Candidatus Zixiibacteriota bacterium]